MVDFDAEQILDERLCDMLVAKNKAGHNRVGDVKRC
jgi:hypothetical protein